MRALITTIGRNERGDLQLTIVVPYPTVQAYPDEKEEMKAKKMYERFHLGKVEIVQKDEEVEE